MREYARNGALVWEPSTRRCNESQIAAFISWLNTNRELALGTQDYDRLWQWSTHNIDAFWKAVADYFELDLSGYSAVVDGPIDHATWFPGAEINFAQRLLMRARSLEEAIIGENESGRRQVISGAELEHLVHRVAAALKERGVGSGDVVASYMPNIPETIVAFLATASIGAIWTSCAPEFGKASVLDRFSQVQPKLLFVVDGYQYRGDWYDRRAIAMEISNGLPSVEHVVAVQLGSEGYDSKDQIIVWSDLTEERSNLPFEYERLPFEHPLWILYSSGTTGMPKAIVHSHGGSLLEQSKFGSLHLDLTYGDRFFWYTTTGWVMWNIVVSALLTRASIVLYDGDLQWPNPSRVWQFVGDNRITYLGLSAGFIHSAMKRRLTPMSSDQVQSLRTVGSTGSTLSPEGFKWLYDEVKQDVFVASISGGTDVASAFLSGAPVLPVHSGEIQRAALGVDVAAFDEAGQPIVDQVGEMVIRKPMPSMPIFLWGDTDRRLLRETYFDMFPGSWRHGDWIRVTKRNTYVISGRSDATLNRGGVRMGTSEFYRILDQIERIDDSLIVDTTRDGKAGELILFVEMRQGQTLDEGSRDALAKLITDELSPRHRPDHIYQVQSIPRTLSGKRMEIPVANVMLGAKPESVVSVGAMSNPESMQEIVAIREQHLRN